MRYVLTAEEMRALDAATINSIGIPGAVLMENAGRAVSEHVLALLATDFGQSEGEGKGKGKGEGPAHGRPDPANDDSHVAVVCGGGNNGGDGYVVARWLREAGVSATVYLAAAEETIRGDAALHLGAYQQSGGTLLSIADGAKLAEQRDNLANADVIVDCLFGTGLDREVVGHYAAVIDVLNHGRGDIVACDIPSGLSADTGEELGVAVRADYTVTLAFLKRALAVSPGFPLAGQVSIAPIGIPTRLAQAQGICVALLEASDLAGAMPEISALDYKNRRGHLLVVGGSPGKLGAGRLTAWSALRTGAGLVTLGAADYDAGAPDPVMTARVDDPQALLALARDKRVVALGPGMALGETGARLIYAALEELEMPLVLDADALNHLGTDLSRVASAAAPAVLTPHPGEAARLLGRKIGEVQRDRIAAVRELAEHSAAVVVLKGARTLVCDGITGDGFVTVNPTGNAGLATAGSGDVLTGVIAGLMVQGTAPADAARLGVWLHGRAADLAVERLGMRSLTASDLADALPAALQQFAV